MSYSCKDVADSFGVEVKTIYNWIQKGKIKAKKKNFRDYEIEKSEIDRVKMMLNGEAR